MQIKTIPDDDRNEMWFVAPNDLGSPVSSVFSTFTLIDRDGNELVLPRHALIYIWDSLRNPSVYEHQIPNVPFSILAIGNELYISRFESELDGMMWSWVEEDLFRLEEEIEAALKLRSNFLYVGAVICPKNGDLQGISMRDGDDEILFSPSLTIKLRDVIKSTHGEITEVEYRSGEFGYYVVLRKSSQEDIWISVKSNGNRQISCLWYYEEGPDGSSEALLMEAELDDLIKVFNLDGV